MQGAIKSTIYNIETNKDSIFKPILDKNGWKGKKYASSPVSLSYSRRPSSRITEVRTTYRVVSTLLSPVCFTQQPIIFLQSQRTVILNLDLIPWRSCVAVQKKISPLLPMQIKLLVSQQDIS